MESPLYRIPEKPADLTRYNDLSPLLINPWMAEQFYVCDILQESENYQVVRGYAHEMTYKDLVVLKAIHTTNPSDFHYFAQATKTLLKLKHPNITPLLDFYLDESHGDIIQVYPHGFSVEVNLRAEAYLGYDECIWMMLDVLNALEYSQKVESGTSHGNLKPTNIIRIGGVYKVTDWNAPKLFMGLEGDTSIKTRNFTVMYGAPEVIDASVTIVKKKKGKHEAVDAYEETPTRWDPEKVDIFSLGLIALQILGISGNHLEGFNMEAPEFYEDRKNAIIDKLEITYGSDLSHLINKLLTRNSFERPGIQEAKQLVIALSVKPETSDFGNEIEYLRSQVERVKSYYNDKRFERVAHLCENLNPQSVQKVKTHGELGQAIAVILKEAYEIARHAYKELRDFKNALKFALKKLDIEKLLYGEINLKIAKCHEEVGAAYISMKEFPSALECYQKSLEVRRKIITKVDSEMADTYSRIGILFNYIGEHKSSVENHLIAYDARKKELGEKDFRTVNSYGNVSIAYRLLEEYERALKFHSNQLDSRKLVFGDNSDEVMTSYIELAWASIGCRDANLAFDYAEKAVNICLTLYKEGSPQFAKVMGEVAFLHKQSNDLIRAQDSYRIAIKFFERAVDEEYLIPLMECYKHSASIHFIETGYEKALRDYEKALEIGRKIKKKLDDPDLSEDPETLDRIKPLHYFRQGIEKLLKFFQSFQSLIKDRFGGDHLLMALVYNNGAMASEIIEKYQEAVANYEKTLEIQRKMPECSHLMPAGTLKNLSTVYQKLGDRSRSINYGLRALDAYRDLRRQKMYQLGISTDQPTHNVGGVHSLMSTLTDKGSFRMLPPLKAQFSQKGALKAKDLDIRNSIYKSLTLSPSISIKSTKTPITSKVSMFQVLPSPVVSKNTTRLNGRTLRASGSVPSLNASTYTPARGRSVQQFSPGRSEILQSPAPSFKISKRIVERKTKSIDSVFKF